MPSETAPDELPAKLATMPREILHAILAHLPAVDAYFLRFVSRVLRVPAAMRVEAAAKEMLIRDKNPHEFFDFLRGVYEASLGRPGGREALEMSPSTAAALLVALDSLVCIEFLDIVCVLLEYDEIMRTAVLKPLGADVTTIRVCMQHFAARDPPGYHQTYPLMLKNIGLSFEDALGIAKRLHGGSLADRGAVT